MDWWVMEQSLKTSNMQHMVIYWIYYFKLNLGWKKWYKVKFKNKIAYKINDKKSRAQ